MGRELAAIRVPRPLHCVPSRLTPVREGLGEAESWAILGTLVPSLVRGLEPALQPQTPDFRLPRLGLAGPFQAFGLQDQGQSRLQVALEMDRPEHPHGRSPAGWLTWSDWGCFSLGSG